MQNKPNKSWLDVQIVIITLVMTISLFLWNLFASGSPSKSTAMTANVQIIPVPPSSAPAQPPAPTQPSALAQPSAPAQPGSGLILLGGAAPQKPSVSRAQAPAPVTVTRSSRP
jgi:hypothetical protein